MKCPNCNHVFGTRKTAKAEKRTARRDRMAAIRAEVEARCGGHCEICATGRMEEAHHALSGPLRRLRESVDTVLGLCGPCHRALHKSDPDALESAAIYCESAGMHEAAASLRRRFDRVCERRAE